MIKPQNNRCKNQRSTEALMDELNSLIKKNQEQTTRITDSEDNSEEIIFEDENYFTFSNQRQFQSNHQKRKPDSIEVFFKLPKNYFSQGKKKHKNKRKFNEMLQKKISQKIKNLQIIFPKINNLSLSSVVSLWYKR